MNELSEKFEAQPSAEEIEQAATVLHRLAPGLLPPEIFRETTRLTATPIIELVPLRNVNGQTEVLLFQRPDDDPVWPKQLHSPGTVVRPTDATAGLQAPLQRLYSDELQVEPASRPVYVSSVLHQVARGAELATVLYVDMNGTNAVTGQWFPADQLPENIIDHQISFITDAVRAYEGRS